jgi:hypothetical protein
MLMTFYQKKMIPLEKLQLGLSQLAAFHVCKLYLMICLGKESIVPKSPELCIYPGQRSEFKSKILQTIIFGKQ